MPEVRFRETVAIDGPYSRFLAAQQANRDVVASAPDLRSDPRQSVDRAWEGLRADCEARFGRAPSTESWDQPSDGATMALNLARRAEADLLGLQHAGAPAAAVAGAFDIFADALASWANYVTRGWPNAKQFARQQARAAEERYR